MPLFEQFVNITEPEGAINRMRAAIAGASVPARGRTTATGVPSTAEHPESAHGDHEERPRDDVRREGVGSEPVPDEDRDHDGAHHRDQQQQATANGHWTSPRSCASFSERAAGARSERPPHGYRRGYTVATPVQPARSPRPPERGRGTTGEREVQRVAAGRAVMTTRPAESYRVKRRISARPASVQRGGSVRSAIARATWWIRRATRAVLSASTRSTSSDGRW